MNIVIIGQDNVGGGLAAQWRRTGHQVTAPGRGGWDASGADGAVMAVPGPAISAATARVTRLSAEIAIDATSALPFRKEAFGPRAEVSFTAGPVAEVFNLNFAILYDQIAAQWVRPSSFCVAEDAARTVTEEPITGTGYDPVPLGGLGRTPRPGGPDLAAHCRHEEGAPIFYRLAVRGEL